MNNSTEHLFENTKSPRKNDASANFSIKTLTSIPSTKLSKHDSVHCTSSNLYVVTAIEDEVCVYKEDSDELVWSFKGGAPIEFIALSDDSSFLLLAEKLDVVFLCYIPTKETIWSTTLNDDRFENMTVKNIFFCSSAAVSEEVRIYVLTKEDILFKFSYPDISQLYKEIEAFEYSAISHTMVEKKIDLSQRFPSSEVKDGFLLYGRESFVGLSIKTWSSFEPVEYIDDDYDDVNSYVYEYEFNSDKVKGGDLSMLFEGNVEFKNQPEIPTFEMEDSVKICCTRSGRYLVGLNEMGHLKISCAFTQMELKSFEEMNIKDFILVETENSNYDMVIDIKIGMLLQLSCDNGPTYNVFELRSFPFLEKIYSTDMSSYMQLIDCKFNQEFWPFLESGKTTDSVNANEFEFLTMKRICETSPESRLQSLIRKRKFLEAEKFAVNSNLDSEVVHKSKIVCLLKDLSSVKKTLSNLELDNIWNEIKLSLKKIQDMVFIVQKLMISLPNAQLMEKWLSTVRTWLISSPAQERTTDYICLVNRNLNKLITFQLLEASFSLSMPLNEFLSEDLLEYILSRLATGHLSEALLVWKCHKNELLISLTSEDVMNILEKIPFDIPSKILTQFLEEDLLPAVLPRLPSVLSNSLHTGHVGTLLSHGIKQSLWCI